MKLKRSKNNIGMGGGGKRKGNVCFCSPSLPSSLPPPPPPFFFFFFFCPFCGVVFLYMLCFLGKETIATQAASGGSPGHCFKNLQESFILDIQCSISDKKPAAALSCLCYFFWPQSGVCFPVSSFFTSSKTNILKFQFTVGVTHKTNFKTLLR